MADPSSSAASKDNANPVIHSQATETVRRDHTLGGYTDDQEWWRDSGMKLASSSSGLHDGSQHELQDWFNDAAAAGNDDDEVKKLLKDTMDIDGDKQAPALVDGREEIDQQEIFDLVRSITDPEHPLTLEQLAVVNPQHITITPSPSTPHILLEFTPTIPHCSMSTLIGLSLRVRLLRSLSPKYKVDIRVRPGTHQSEDSVNKQLNDKERVAAALENQHLLEVVMQTLSSAYKRGGSRTAAAVGPGIEGKSNSSALAGNDMEMMEDEAQKDSALEQAEMLARLLGVTV